MYIFIYHLFRIIVIYSDLFFIYNYERIFIIIIRNNYDKLKAQRKQFS